MSAPTTHPVTPDRWDDLETLFGPKGAGGGCWCQLLRQRRRDWEAGKGAVNRERLRAAVEAGPPPGVLAYDGGAPVGWCSVAPRTALPGLATSRILKPVDDAPVWSITCFFLRKDRRRMGISVPLLEAAVALAAAQGGAVVEGYPIDPPDGAYTAAFAWTGFRRTFDAAGFVEVARRSPTRPIMRRGP